MSEGGKTCSKEGQPFDVLMYWERMERVICGVYVDEREIRPYRDITSMYATKGYSCPRCGTGFCYEPKTPKYVNKYAMAAIEECPFCGYKFTKGGDHSGTEKEVGQEGMPVQQEEVADQRQLTDPEPAVKEVTDQIKT